ncbi:MAG TPA: hypothetical protein VMG98_10395 [Verrucomicrobiae bacterium]|nr:hypothetical protein [Verrucomicrobiae bacterium]
MQSDLRGPTIESIDAMEVLDSRGSPTVGVFTPRLGGHITLVDVSETIDAWRDAVRGGYKTVVSHRSGGTRGTFISDLAVKYNRLLEIEPEMCA